MISDYISSTARQFYPENQGKKRISHFGIWGSIQHPVEEIFVIKFGHRLMVSDQVLSSDHGHCYKLALARGLQKCGPYSAMLIESMIL